MIKQEAVASLGQTQLLRPALLREALKANDRLKLCLTLLQAGAQRARAPAAPAPDLGAEIAATDIDRHEDVRWLRELPGRFVLDGALLRVPGLPRLRARMKDDLRRMAAPMADAQDAPAGWNERFAGWQAALAVDGEELSAEELASLTRGQRGAGDSLHLLVMDLHKAINRLAAQLSETTIDGAHAWQLAPDGSDEPRVSAFMRGVHRTAPLKLDHPGLDTSATRDGEHLLIQNDIGTNDAHVLVIRVSGLAIELTYSDLHRQRFGFFQRMLAAAGAQWASSGTRVDSALNEGAAFHIGTAVFQADDAAAQCAQLEAIGSRIVFLIDWNRARKRLVQFVAKEAAIGILEQAAQRECGHMAWLRAGGERMVWNAMAAQRETDFRLGDRLDDVLSQEAARDYLLQVLEMSWHAAQRHLPAAFAADEARLLLSRALAGQHRGFELLQEHAALCHALAEAIDGGLAHGVERDQAAASRLALRAKGWERLADELVSRARGRAERQPQWKAFSLLIECADDIADCLEEAAYVLSVLAERGEPVWTDEVRAPLLELSRMLLRSVQSHVKAVATGAVLEPGSDSRDESDYLDALWQVLQAERSCDELHREFRRAAAGGIRDAATLVLSNELAEALESASDALLAFGYALREHALGRAGGAAG